MTEVLKIDRADFVSMARATCPEAIDIFMQIQNEILEGDFKKLRLKCIVCQQKGHNGN